MGIKITFQKEPMLIDHRETAEDKSIDATIIRFNDIPKLLKVIPNSEVKEVNGKLRLIWE